MATGGTITTYGNYHIHTFNSSGTFATNVALTINYVVVGAGGGNGGADHGTTWAGGGGAGGLQVGSSVSLAAGSYSVVVGAGGTGNSIYGAGGTGGTSSFNGVSKAGGAGGSWWAKGGTSNSGYGGGNGAVGSGGGGGGNAGAGANAGDGQTDVAGGAGTSIALPNTTITFSVGGKGGYCNSRAPSDVPGCGGCGRYPEWKDGMPGVVIIWFIAPPPAPTITSATQNLSDKVTISWSSGGADGPTTGYYLYRDGTLIYTGASTSYNDTGATAPTITPGSTVASKGTSTAHVALSLSGTSTGHTSHTYTVYAYGAGGTSVVSNSANGWRLAGTLTYQWQMSAGASDASYSNITGATSSTHNATTAPAPTITPGSTVASKGTSTAHVALSLSGTSNNVGTTRYFRCYLTAAGASSQYSAANAGYRAAGTLVYQWQRSAANSDANYSTIGTNTSTYNDTGAPVPIISAGTAVATFGEWTNRIELTNPNISNNNGEQRYYRCNLYATPATSGSSTVDQGYRAAGTSACQWIMSTGDTDENYVVLSGATTINYTYTPGPNDKHYFKLMITASPAASAASTPAIGRRSNGLYLFNG